MKHLAQSKVPTGDGQLTEPRVAAVDLRGYGDSDKTPRGYDLTTAASDMVGVIRGLGYAQAIVVGHGYGGMIAWTLAAHNPDRVAGIVTIGSAHPLVQFRALLSAPHKQWRRVRRTLVAQLPRYPEAQIVKDNGAKAEQIFRTGVAPGFRDTDLYKHFAQKRRAAILVDKVAHLSAEYQRWPFRSHLRPEGSTFARTFPAQVSTPALVIEGSMDPDYQPLVTEKSAARSTAGHTELLYGVGHYPHIEDAPAVAELITSFMAKYWPC